MSALMKPPCHSKLAKSQIQCFCTTLLKNFSTLSFFYAPFSPVAGSFLDPHHLFFFKCYLFIFRERGREGEREGEKHWCERETSVSCLLSDPWSLTRDWTHNLGMCPDQESNQWPFSLQDNAQPMEPHQSNQSPSFSAPNFGSLSSLLSTLYSCVF